MPLCLFPFTKIKLVAKYIKFWDLFAPAIILCPICWIHVMDSWKSAGYYAFFKIICKREICKLLFQKKIRMQTCWHSHRSHVYGQIVSSAEANLLLWFARRHKISCWNIRVIILQKLWKLHKFPRFFNNRQLLQCMHRTGNLKYRADGCYKYCRLPTTLQ